MIFNTDKIVIGTAQLASNYGVTNYSFPNQNDSFKILETAYSNRIKFFDTAPSYNSENIIGDFIKSNGLSKKINILTKIVSLENKFSESLIKKNIEISLNKLNTSIHTLFFHDPKDVLIFLKHLDFFLNLKKIFPIKNIGFSIYEPKQASLLINNKLPISFQFPYNIVDQRFATIKFKDYNKLFCRSVFLQGLLLNRLNYSNVPKKLKLFQNNYFSLLKKMNIEPLDLILTFLNMNKNFNYFIFGIDNVIQLKKLLNFNFNNKVNISLIKKINSFFFKKLRDPRTWNFK